MRHGFWLSLLLLAAVGACAQPLSYAQIAPSLAGPPPGLARIVVYRDWSYQSPSWVPVFFNGARVSAVGPGYVMLRDVPPGTYDISVASQGLYPNQNKIVAAAPGQTFYAKIETVRGLDPGANRPVPLTTFVVVLVEPAIAQREIAPLWYTAQRQDRAAAGRS